LRREKEGFTAELREVDGTERRLRAHRVLLATGGVDVEPALPDLPDAVRRGLVRYCPICDGYEARHRNIAVIGHGARGLSEALYIRRTYGAQVTVLTLGQPLALDAGQREEAAQHAIGMVEEPVAALEVQDGHIRAVRTGSGRAHAFDTLYSTLGLRYRTGLAEALGVRMDEGGAILVDDGNETSLPGLHAAGDIVHGVDQIVVGMGHAAIAATRIHKQLIGVSAPA
jgi:thioredoxin reductase (NADPH)